MKKNIKGIIFIALVIILLIIFVTILMQTENINKITEALFKQDEENLIDVEIVNVVKKENSSSGTIKFTTKYSNEKIKQIECPTKENETPFIVYTKDEGKETVAMDYTFEKGRELEKFKITTTSGQVIETSVAYTVEYNTNGGTEEPEKESTLLGQNTKITSLAPKREGFHFCGWSENKDAVVPDYFLNGEYKYTKDNDKVMLYAVWIKESDISSSVANNDSLLGKVSEVENGGLRNITVNNTQYSANIIYLDGDVVLDGQTQIEGATLTDNVYEFGNEETDVGTASENASNMVVLKVHGNLTINYGVTLTTCKSSAGYGGPKGLLVYCDGELINNGTMTMTQRGAKAEGQDVYLWKNEDGTYEYVPAVGGAGGAGVWANNKIVAGIAGTSGTDRRTGGGGSGAGRDMRDNVSSFSGSGGLGTSYSGGPGGGSAETVYGAGDVYAGNASNSGGAGGASAGAGAGGAGNPGGKDYGSNGTGGLLISYSRVMKNLGKITSNGTNGSIRVNQYPYSGSSGAGSINIFYNDQYTNSGIIKAEGGKTGNGGAGGNGSITETDISPEVEETE